MQNTKNLKLYKKNPHDPFSLVFEPEKNTIESFCYSIMPNFHFYFNYLSVESYNE